jgi:8-oxo-dGTP diphosphatase
MNKSAGVIVRSGNKILLCKRNNEGILPGYWSIPAGNIENGETPLDAAYREFFEETNISITNKNLTFVGVVQNLYIYILDSNKKIYPDLVSAEDGDEHTECDYFGRNDLPEPMVPQFTRLIKAIIL